MTQNLLVLGENITKNGLFFFQERHFHQNPVIILLNNDTNNGQYTRGEDARDGGFNGSGTITAIVSHLNRPT